MASFGLKVIRGVFAAAEHVAPRLTGRAAFELFCRTPNAKVLSDGERRAVDRAAGFMTEARHHRLKTKNGCVMVHEFRPEPGRRAAGTVLVIHGWRSRTEYMRTLIEGYRDAGYKVVSLDLPGHGQSQGRRLTLVSAVEAARLTGEWFGPFVAVVGHSFGGAVAANAVVGSVKNIPPLAAERLVLIAAPSSLPAIFNDFSRMLSVGPRSQAAMADRVERIAGRPLHEFVGDRQLASTPVPTLVIHAPDDREVSADHARLYAGAGDHVRLYWADGLGHRRILADRGVVERAIGFVAEHREPSLLH
ncbi:MAG: alpha/beta fold hydrolase [Mesorhizobium sp.]|uniref:alpha/beta hydrolase n=1 Tax=unclassified Mesorhizobium TaxID=325217 RepID=UPI000FC9E535|nr:MULTISPECIES: alpha/beta fold hydrolase [unclassified Mesorhizobium]RUV71564.1 alpha/beta fold hydrolase [Mesorhizobium sp. M5C.F.Cr.IN.023.01.1.1]RWF89843.1 MAG: alpha/beta fold hydrolase [Mesorhizobium sp.]RWF95988.1 MAG: alpha/beta fold hydrolase [Mesorhizobium sp.]RWI40983.1 MAG: alpha/beta fold hydrolase [Mesorhizobium sp.]RWI46664.1 MAG: alpha/beta fold hydrolase [Mesorhizobium sp.]